ncbi:MAG: hypothetical protein R2939_21035 [Kofleriaceae bacterium]
MVAVDEGAAAAAPSAVEPVRQRDQQPAHAVAERAGGVGLDEEVQVVALDGGVDHAEVGACELGGEGGLDVGEAVVRPQPGELAHHAHGDVHGLARRHLRARGVPELRALALGLATGASARAAMRPKGQRTLPVAAGAGTTLWSTWSRRRHARTVAGPLGALKHEMANR